MKGRAKYLIVNEDHRITYWLIFDIIKDVIKINTVVRSISYSIIIKFYGIVNFLRYYQCDMKSA